MIDSGFLNDRVNAYKAACDRAGRRPTYQGLGDMLGICRSTVGNICLGCFARGRPYTDTPSPTRRVSNEDFSIIQDIFGGAYDS